MSAMITTPGPTQLVNVNRHQSSVALTLIPQGLPAEWQRTLQQQGISENEQKKNPQAVVDIVNFYKDAAEGRSEDEIFHKFDHARAPEMQQVDSQRSSQGANGYNASLVSPAMSTPTSPRFPSNHEGSFVNPRQAPPIPAYPREALVPARPAPRPPGGALTSPNLVAHRPAPAAPAPVTKTSPQQPIYSATNQLPAVHSSPHDDVGPEVPSKNRTRSQTGSASNAQLPAQGLGLAINYQQQQEQQAPVVAQKSPQQQQLARSASQGGAYAHKPSPLAPQQHNPPNDSREGPTPRPRPQRREITHAEIISRLQQICTPGDPTQRYRNLNTVGKGASGAVYTAYEVGTNKCVAIKQMNLQQQPKKELIINEIIVMKGSKHKNIVNFLDSYLVVGDLWVVMEYMEGGSLTDVVTFNMMSEGQIAAVCREVCCALIDFENTLAYRDRLSKDFSTYTLGMLSIETSSPTTFCCHLKDTSS